MAQILKNNVSGVLSTQLNSADTSMVLVDASNFPAPTGGDFYLLTLVGLNTNGQEATWEVVKVTAKAINTLSITRAQESTTNQLWPVGTAVQMRLTAGSVATKDDLTTKQPLDAELTAIAALAGTSGLLKKTAANTWSLDTTAYTTNVGDVTLTGAQTLTNKTLTGYTETVYNLAGTDIAVANGTIQTKTLSANTTFTESLADGQSVILGITAGAFSITWPSVTWTKVGGSGVAPTLTSSGVNWVILWQVGGVLRGSFMGTA